MSKFVSNGISKSMLNLKKVDNWQTEVIQLNCSNTVSFNPVLLNKTKNKWKPFNTC